MRRVSVVGSTCSGKTTFARELAAVLGVPAVELDALNWGANWTMVDEPLFRQRVDQATSGDAWVVDGNYIDEWTHVTPLSLASYGTRIYASDKMSNLAILDEDSGEVLERVENIAIYIHQMAMDAHGDLYTASVYPEHAGALRGPTGPSHRRWSRAATA